MRETQGTGKTVKDPDDRGGEGRCGWGVGWIEVLEKQLVGKISSKGPNRKFFRHPTPLSSRIPDFSIILRRVGSGTSRSRRARLDLVPGESGHVRIIA